MFSDQQNPDDVEEPKKGNKNGHRLDQLVHDHVKNSVRNLRDQYGINDEKLNHIHNLKEADNAMAAQGDIVLSGGIAVLYLFMNLLSDIAQFKYLEMQQKAKVSRDAQNMANTVSEQIADVAKGKDPDTTKVSLDPNVIKYMEDNDVKVGDKTIDQYLDEKGDTPTDLTLKSSDGKTSLHVYEKDGQWYMQNKALEDKLGPTGMGLGVMGITEGGKPVKIAAPTFDNGKVSLTIDDSHKYPNNPLLSQYDIPKGTKFSGTYTVKSYRKIDKGELDAVKSALENESNRASDYVSQSQLQLQKVMQTYNVTVSLINSMQTMLEEMNKSIAQNIR
ncbi:secretion protein EspA [Shewanella sp. OPT22]|nr:secretion protein EspA [Shewanella sp. OPT22]